MREPIRMPAARADKDSGGHLLAMQGDKSICLKGAKELRPGSPA